MYWIDYKGQRQPYGTIEAGATGKQSTFVTHPWVVTDEADKCLYAFVATSSSKTINIGSGAAMQAQPAAAQNVGCDGGKWRGKRCVCPAGLAFDAGRCSAEDHGGVNCAATGEFYDGISCVAKCPAGTVGRAGFCQ